jgi:hypothetical protein
MARSPTTCPLGAKLTPWPMECEVDGKFWGYTPANPAAGDRIPVYVPRIRASLNNVPPVEHSGGRHLLH